VSRVTYEELFTKFPGNKYLLVNVAAFRARQINEGVEVYVKSQSRHPLEMALLEIQGGFIGYELGVPDEVVEDEPYDEDLMAFDEMVETDAALDFDDEEEEFDLEAIEFEDEDLTKAGLLQITDE
jgi:DNA-directed RNA polymerase omega subunit